MATIYTTSPIFDPDNDAKELHDSFDDSIIREKEIAYILCNRSNVQRQLIKKHFKHAYDQELLDFWGEEVTGDFLDVAKALLASRAEYDAANLNSSMKGLGTDEKAMMEILFTRSYEELEEIKDAYQRLYQKSLEKAVRSETSGDYRKLVQNILTVPRSSGPAHTEMARDDATKLYKSGEGKLGTDESVFIDLLSCRSYAHLRAVFAEYEAQYKTSFETAIEKETSGDFRKALLYLVSIIGSGEETLAEDLQRAFSNKKGKDDVIRLIVSHCERDLLYAKEPFERLEKQSLEETLQERTKDDLQMFLLTLV